MHNQTTKIGLKGLSRLACALLALPLLAGSGCVQPDEINRVQPNLIKKSALEGEWYMLDTVVKAPYAGTRGFNGYQGAVDRGIFEVEEDYVYFYRTYEFVQNVEAQGMKGDTDTPLLDANGDPIVETRTLPDGTTETVERYVYRSAPLARWMIKAHVDVRKSYNPNTGEESNVTVEDACTRQAFAKNDIERLALLWDPGLDALAASETVNTGFFTQTFVWSEDRVS